MGSTPATSQPINATTTVAGPAQAHSVSIRFVNIAPQLRNSMWITSAERIDSEFDVRQVRYVRPTRREFVDGRRLRERHALVLELRYALDVSAADDVHARGVGALFAHQVTDHRCHLGRRQLIEEFRWRDVSRHPRGGH